MQLETFSFENKARCESPNGFGQPINNWNASDWLLAVVGELGEAANICKKIKRAKAGIPGNAEYETVEYLQKELADELADTFTYLDLLAQSEGINLSKAVMRKFEVISAKIGYRKTFSHSDYK